MKAMRTCCDYFTSALTPTLSLGEREHCAPSLAMTCVGEGPGQHGAMQCEPMLFPLPAGEGQGEGDRREQKGAFEFL